MHCYNSLWWIFPVVCFGMMLIFSIGVARRGGRGWCFPSRHQKDTRERIHKLEEEIQNLKQNIIEERAAEKVENDSIVDL